MAILFIWIFIILFLMTKNSEKILLYIPSVLILSKLSSQLVSLQQYDRYEIILNYITMFYVIFVSVSILLKRVPQKKDKLNRLIYIFILLLLFLVFITSSDIWLSFKRSLGIIASLLLFLAVYYSRISYVQLQKGTKQVIIYLLLFAFNGLILSFFKIGPSINEFYYMEGYSASFIRLGNFNFFELHGIAILTGFVLVFIKIVKSKNWKILLIIVSLINITILYFTYKRTFLAVVLAEVLLYYFLSTISSSKKLINAFTAIFSIAILYILFGSYISAFINKRAKVNTKVAIENTGRILEFSLYPDVVKNRDNKLLFVLFGVETFNSAGKFTVLNRRIQGGEARFLHNDFAHLLYGTGIIGLSLYLSILLNIFRKSYYYVNKFSKNRIIRYVSIASLMTVSGIFLSGLGDGILAFHNRVVPFFTLGLFLSFLRNYYIYEKR